MDNVVLNLTASELVDLLEAVNSKRARASEMADQAELDDKPERAEKLRALAKNREALFYKLQSAAEPVRLTEAQAIAILDKWVAADPGARTWRMEPFVAGFVACRLEDERLREFGDRWAWEFGNVNALPGQAFADARIQAAESIRSGLDKRRTHAA